MRHRLAVADQEDDVLGDAAFGRAVHVPGNRRALVAGDRLDDRGTGLRHPRAADPIGGVPEVVLVDGDPRLAAEHLRRVLTVDGHLDVGRRDGAGKLDFEVERRAGEYLRTVDRIDGLTDRGGCEGAQRHEGANDRRHVPGFCPDLSSHWR